MGTKTADIKTRVEPMLKLSLEQVAREEGLELSDITRRAFAEFLERRAGMIRAQGNAVREKTGTYGR